MERYIFRLPDIGEGIAEAEIVAWQVKIGDHIAEEQSMVEVMTDKATVELMAPIAGLVIAVHGDIGQLVQVGSPLVELDIDQSGAAGESVAGEVVESSISGLLPDSSTSASAVESKNSISRPNVAKAETGRSSSPAIATRVKSDAPLASPATRRRAYELGIALQFVPPTGPAGRITAKDLDEYAARGKGSERRSDTYIKRTGITEIKIVGLRRKIAEKLVEAKRRIPHFSYVEEFDLTELESLRHDLNAARRSDQPKLSLLPFFMRGLVKLVPDFPRINARYDDEAEILYSYDAVHIGIATQTADGLMVPVVRHAETRDLWECAAELARVTSAAREGSAKRDELVGSSITLTSLGALGGISATPIINHPEVAIIGPNKLVERPIVVDGQVTIRRMMNVSSSFDHRIIDGYDAAEFIHALRRLIERPALLFLDRA